MKLDKNCILFVFVLKKKLYFELKKKKRSIVVRETNGVLRKANQNEREKMIQVYYPKPGKPSYIPEMFNPLRLEVLAYNHSDWES